jgi:hypothetical protein
MEKKFVERELKVARAGIIILGILSWFFMLFSEYGDKTFRWALISIIVGITLFMYAVITFLLYSLSNK